MAEGREKAGGRGEERRMKEGRRDGEGRLDDP
jgi:hypothetical protein